MHGFDDAPTTVKDDPTDKRPWYKLLTSYHWFVLFVCALGWLFDCLDQQLFILARPAAMKELITEVAVSENGQAVVSQDPKALDQSRRTWGDITTSVFIAGWATGGLFFGMLGDRWGRARTMLLTILIYSLFTGLSAISQSVYDFAFYRFLTGLGVGGEFAVGVALVAEVMPARARPYTLALLQALSAIGNVSAAFINMGLGVAEEQGMVSSPWRVMFLVGALPALLALVIRGRLKEPEQWKAVSLDGAAAKQLGSYSELFSDPRWRKNAIVGLLLACSGVIGLWAVGFFSPDLTRFVLRKRIAMAVYEQQIDKAKAENNASLVAQFEEIKKLEMASGSTPATIPTELQDAKAKADPSINADLAYWQSMTSIGVNVGAFFGMFGFGLVAQRIGRKPTFAMALLAAFFSTVAVFWYLNEFWQIFVMVPVMGFCQLSLFAGYAIYFPELFPTRLRSTGTSFCYNVGRFIAAGGPLAKASLEAAFADTPEPLRYAGVAMCAVFLIGLVVLPFAPETRGKPLPE
jgi:MFS family permease